MFFWVNKLKFVKLTWIVVSIVCMYWELGSQDQYQKYKNTNKNNAANQEIFKKI